LLLFAKGIDFELTPGTGKQKKNLQLCYANKKYGTKTSELK
jgi:hypothetical protein